MHKLGRISDLERAMRKIETCGSACIVVELEQTLYTVSHSLEFAKTDVGNSCGYGLMFCMAVNSRAWA